MKPAILLLVFSVHFGACGQPLDSSDISIDTIRFHANAYGLYELTSQVPKIRSKKESDVTDKINKTVAPLFLAGLLRFDTSGFAQHTVGIFDSAMVQGVKEEEDFKGATFQREGFEIAFPTANMMVVRSSGLIEPAGGRPQYFNRVVTFDLRTGSPITLRDLLSIDAAELLKRFNEFGYFENEHSDGSTKRQYDLMLGKKYQSKLEEMLGNFEPCLPGYLKQTKDGLHLQFIDGCFGPTPIIHGVPLKVLEDHVIHNELKAAH